MIDYGLFWGTTSHLEFQIFVSLWNQGLFPAIRVREEYVRERETETVGSCVCMSRVYVRRCRHPPLPSFHCQSTACFKPEPSRQPDITPHRLLQPEREVLSLEIMNIALWVIIITITQSVMFDHKLRSVEQKRLLKQMSAIKQVAVCSTTFL